MPSCRPTNSVKALKAMATGNMQEKFGENLSAVLKLFASSALTLLAGHQEEHPDFTI